jgi:hypothetical protein
MRRLWEWWKRVARKIGDFQARVILTAIYFIVIGPFALIVRWGMDPLSIKPRGYRGWIDKLDATGARINRALSQF